VKTIPPKGRWFLFGLTLGLMGMLLPLTATAQGETRPGEARNSEARFLAQITSQLDRAKGQYRRGDIDDRELWNVVLRLYVRADRAEASHSDLNQFLGYLLKKEGYPYLSGDIVAEAIASDSEPFSDKFLVGWQLLKELALGYPIVTQLQQLANHIRPSRRLPPILNREWMYYQGMALAERGMHEQAISSFRRLSPEDRYFLHANYQMAILYFELKQFDRARRSLERLLGSLRSSTKYEVTRQERHELEQLVRLALGRINFELEEFMPAVTQYRRVDRDSSFFYTSLFEQSWALFRAGFPNHALGTLYSSDAPFFSGRFNPEAVMLRALVYYWMCRYEDSRVILNLFNEYYAPAVRNLDEFLARQNLDGDRAYELFENVLTGVSSESLGMDRDLLLSATRSPAVVDARLRLATLLEERNRLRSVGVYGTTRGLGVIGRRLDRQINRVRSELGQSYLLELEFIKENFADLRYQLSFLSVELLMSQKEQLQGRQLHAESRFHVDSETARRTTWSRNAQSWRGGQMGEFWWDEVGFYLFDLPTLCVGDGGSR